MEFKGFMWVIAYFLFPPSFYLVLILVGTESGFYKKYWLSVLFFAVVVFLGSTVATSVVFIYFIRSGISEGAVGILMIIILIFGPIIMAMLNKTFHNKSVNSSSRF